MFFRIGTSHPHTALTLGGGEGEGIRPDVEFTGSDRLCLVDEWRRRLLLNSATCEDLVPLPEEYRGARQSARGNSVKQYPNYAQP
jgi:hypothetical protein